MSVTIPFKFTLPFATASDRQRINMAITEYGLEGQLFVQRQAHGKGHLAALAVAYQNDRGAFLCRMDRLYRSGLRSCSFNDQICSSPPVSSFDLRYHVFFSAVDHAGGSKFHGLFQTLVHQVYHINLGYASCLQCHHGYQADAACAHYHCFLSQHAHLPWMAAWNPTARGSISAPSRVLTLSGSLKQRAASCATYS